ncbi:hypothetical protein [Hydrogenophaga sp. R2]|uniref:hypothetical protein n=1 Tax=Hydrogenophaga sp. R2 TaxID=3132827 RepID=UPI003CE66FCF
MNADIRSLLLQLHQERQTGLLSLVIEVQPAADAAEPVKEALSLSFVAGELAAAEARQCQGMQAMGHLARARQLLRQRWYPVSSNVLKRMDGMPVLSVWIQQLESQADPDSGRSNERAQQLDDILRAFHTMGGLDGIERFVGLTAQHPPETAWELLMEALRQELTLYFGAERAQAMTQT